MRYTGSCHCKAVTFAIEAPERVEVEDCNCSICSKAGFLHLILPLSRFELLTGADKLTTYTFNTGVAKHTFCSVCGMKPFYTPRSNPDGIDINVRCLDTKPSLTIVPFDGQQWEQNAAALAGKSKDAPAT
ncbi:MAG: GFA family protein [Pseudomonadota bacterium]|nr:GFA family protein [Pseudomonadota bacterium]